MKPVFVKILTKEPRVSADKKYAVECRTTGSRPDAVITWWMANKQIKKVVQNVSIPLTLLSIAFRSDQDDYLVQSQ